MHVVCECVLVLIAVEAISIRVIARRFRFGIYNKTEQYKMRCQIGRISRKQFLVISMLYCLSRKIQDLENGQYVKNFLGPSAVMHLLDLGMVGKIPIFQGYHYVIRELGLSFPSGRE